MRRFADSFCAGATKNRRIVYYNSRFVDVFRNDPRFVVDEIELPPASHRSALIRPA
jgi:hypothetical protein